jgi:hypothetical protein
METQKRERARSARAAAEALPLVDHEPRSRGVADKTARARSIRRARSHGTSEKSVSSSQPAARPVRVM